MKNVVLLILNGLPMAFLILCYSLHDEMGMLIFLAWFLLCVTNALLSHKVLHLLGINLYLALTSAVGLYANNLFFYSFVYYDDLLKTTEWQKDIRNMFIFIVALTILGVLLRFLIRYIAKSRKTVKDKKIRVIKIGKDAIYELLCDHFVKNQKEYTNVEDEEILYDFSIDWEEKSFIFALGREKDLAIDLAELHKKLPDTAESIYAKKLYRDISEKELVSEQIIQVP